MNVTQDAFAFPCCGEWLMGIVARHPGAGTRGILIAVGGPQYRAGSHRQFKLLADHLAREGTRVMRFDYRGMGDSSGGLQSFEQVHADLRAALDAFFRRAEQLTDVVIWGLCDAASAALLYAYTDPRVSGLVLLNPWVRSDASEARAYLRHYYARRLLTAEPWRKLVRGELDLHAAVESVASTMRRALGGSAQSADARSNSQAGADGSTLPDRMAYGLRRFNGPVLLILSGNDLTASEFSAVTGQSREWRRLLASPRVTKQVLPEATHTFSSRQWRDQVACWTASWVRSW
jgi:exosortase A-associated hydrolase 1